MLRDRQTDAKTYILYTQRDRHADICEDMHRHAER